MLSNFLLSIEDKEMRANFVKEKQAYYRRILLIIWIILILLTVGLFVLEGAGGEDTYKGETATHIVNIVAVVIFFLLWLTVKYFHFCTYLVCPLLTAYAYYYFAMVDYDGSVVSIYYTLIVGITSTFFILIIFNEAWLLSTVVYAPLLGYYMYKTGEDMVGEETNELIIRCIFCVFLYAIVAYRVEALNKQAFMGTQTSEKAFYRWLKIFETFPEGLALIRKQQILYANRSFSGMFEMQDYESVKDPYNERLQQMLQTTEV